MRKYTDVPVEEEKLQRIFAAIHRAPSAGDFQAFVVYVVRKLEQRSWRA